MGFQDRDYSRDGRYTSSLTPWNMDLTPVVKRLIIANVVVFLFQIFLTRPAAPLPDFHVLEPDEEISATDEPGGKNDEPKTDQQKKLEQRQRERAERKAREAMEAMMERMPGMSTSVAQEWLELDPKKTVEQFQIWRLVTSAFCHERFGLWHILFNMLLLWWFGQRLEQMYGSREFFLFYMAAAICSSVAYVVLAYYGGAKVPAIGASGAVMGVMMLYTIHHPYDQFLLFWFVPVPLWALLGLYVIYDIHPVLLSMAGEHMFTNVAHAAHLGGLAFGYLYWRFGWQLAILTGHHRPRVVRRSKPVFRSPEIIPFPQPKRETANDSDRVDEVLKKVSEHGKESLTPEELDILIQASAKYRGKT